MSNLTLLRRLTAAFNPRRYQPRTDWAGRDINTGADRRVAL